MASKAPPPITPKRLLVVPMKAGLLTSKSPSVKIPKVTSISNKAPLVVPRAVPERATSMSVVSPPPAPSMAATIQKPSMSRNGSLKLSGRSSGRGDGNEYNNIVASSSMSMQRQSSAVRSDSVDDSGKGSDMVVDRTVPATVESKMVNGSPVSGSMMSYGDDADSHQPPPSRLNSNTKDQSASSHVFRSCANMADNGMRVSASGSETAPDLTNAHAQGPVPMPAQVQSDAYTSAVGETPWLQIERRINEIRSLASANMHQISARSNRTTDQGATSIYGNYNTHYEPRSEWKQEHCHPMSYGMVQSLRPSKPQQSKPRESWNFVDGFIKPRRKPFASMSEMSRHFRQIKQNDQTELIKLLLACRDLEKVIEEQHAVLDMLDHDLREAREIMQLPEHLRDISSKRLLGRAPQKEPFYPTSDIPLFIKGRVSLMPSATTSRCQS